MNLKDNIRQCVPPSADTSYMYSTPAALYFTIALRSRESTDQWDRVVSDFEATLYSIFNQNCEDFCVYVGCNEIPELKYAFDTRLRFVCVDTPKPKDWLDGCRDRAWKQLACCAQIKKDLGVYLPNDGVFVFPVDADDFVNQKCAAYVKEHPNANGFKSPKGYRWNKGSRRMEISPYFGGTMNIMKLRPDELPDELPDISLCFDKSTCGQLNEKYPVRWDDIAVEEKMAQLGRPLEKLPFRSTIYVLSTGANLSNDDPRNGTTEKKIHWGVLLKKINILNWKCMNKKIRQEFGIQ